MSTDDGGADPDEPDGSDEPDEPDELGERETVTYELGHWSAESRTMLEQLLIGESVPRAWESTDLVVPGAFEVRVDELIDDVIASEQPVLDPDVEKLVYEVATWTPDQQAVLTDALVREGIAYDYTIEGDLVVAASDEDEVERVLDELEDEGDVGEADEGDERPEGVVAAEEDDDGLETAEILTDLFVACDRLTHNAEDADGVLGGVRAAGRLAGRPLPFGYEPRVWESMQTAAAALKVGLEGDETTDEELSEQARDLRDRLRDYV